jgi:hypothetical protein
MLDGRMNAVSVPKLVHGVDCEARRLSSILNAFPYASLSLWRVATIFGAFSVCTIKVQTN